jgi:uncharacterized membrane protein
MLEFNAENRHKFIFIIAASIFLLTDISMGQLDYLYNYGIVFGILSVILFFAYALLYLAKAKDKKRSNLLLDLVFVLTLINFVSMFLFSGPVSNILESGEISALYAVLINGVMITATATAFFLGAYAIRTGRDRRSVRFGYVLICIVIVMVVVYFLSGIAIRYYKIDDEVFIAVRSIKYLVSGLNPYQHSVAQELYYNNTGFSLTANNELIGILNYPALYLYSYIPFYFFVKPTLADMQQYIVPMQAAAFYTILLFAIGFSIEKKHLTPLLISIFIMLAFLFVNVASMTSFLMLALLVLAYAKTGTRYSWLLFGLCISIQELLWIPVILLIIYSIKNYGYRKGIYDILGMLIVFLIINSYFIAISPSAFLNALFNPIQKLIIPGGESPISFLLISNYQITLDAYTYLFGIMILFGAAAVLYTNKKILIGLMSMLPFLFLAHTLSAYIAFFMAFFFISMLMPDEKGKHQSAIRLRLSKPAFIAVTVLLVTISAIVVYNSHTTYASNFNLRVTNQSLHYDTATNETIYNGTLNYSKASQGYAYILFFVYEGKTFGIAGLRNYSLTENPVMCSGNDIDCMINVNRIPLNGSRGTYQINVRLGKANATERIRYARLVIYNGRYYYTAGALFSK